MTDAHSGDDKRYVCDMCNRIFQFRRHYLKHMKVHKDTVFQKCFDCSSAFNSFIQFLDHIKTHELGTALKCAYCSESLSSPDARRLHENNHLIGNRFICKVCNRMFDTEMSLEQHLELHGPEKPINSEVCTGEFTQKKAEETSTHDHDRKKIRCHFVEKSLVANISLNNMKRHTAMRIPIPAQICDQKFKTKNIMKDTYVYIQQRNNIILYVKEFFD
ncbi:hypothetical protein TNIN_421441 [Trichonephila inaurata madagascariensis]|uniref:C2H2-type domain-containing protein n=1 Tax=Trichonephila inaurata madagascariensis TaxID=2747483 RepID=A0A8X6WZ58_9ARAC|nr:hypothetical protein TNIN_421441 [Trichonephila inaurata madagascariensis]